MMNKKLLIFTYSVWREIGNEPSSIAKIRFEPKYLEREIRKVVINAEISGESEMHQVHYQKNSPKGNKLLIVLKDMMTSILNSVETCFTWLHKRSESTTNNKILMNYAKLPIFWQALLINEGDEMTE